jgi:hypothetical protein
MCNMRDEEKEHVGDTEEENKGYVVSNEIFTDQLRNRVVMRKGVLGYSTAPTSFYSRLLDRYLKTT